MDHGRAGLRRRHDRDDRRDVRELLTLRVLTLTDAEKREMAPRTSAYGHRFFVSPDELELL
ncbi:MAG: hypothetical protein ACREMN_00930 [Gemmatimonadales bacterium]